MIEIRTEMGWIFKSCLFDKSPDKYGTVGVTELSNVAEGGGYPENVHLVLGCYRIVSLTLHFFSYFL